MANRLFITTLKFSRNDSKPVGMATCPELVML